MNRRLVFASIAALTIASAAHAQAPTKAAAAAPAAVTTPAPVVVSADMRAAIKELMESTKTREGIAAQLQQMSQAVRPQMGQIMAQRIEVNASLTADQKQQVRASMEQPFENAVTEGQKLITDPKVIDDVVERIVQGYARTFTADEVRQMTAFNKSPTGQKAIASVPQILQTSMQGAMAALVPKLTALADTTVNKQTDAVTKGTPAKSAAPAPKK